MTTCYYSIYCVFEILDCMDWLTDWIRLVTLSLHLFCSAIYVLKMWNGAGRLKYFSLITMCYCTVRRKFMILWLQDPVSPPNGTASPRENGLDKLAPKKEHVGPHRYVLMNWSSANRPGICFRSIAWHLTVCKWWLPNLDPGPTPFLSTLLYLPISTYVFWC
jgi:hypothetical protein